MINEIKRMQQLAGIQLNELEINRDNNKISQLDIENINNIHNYIYDKLRNNDDSIYIKDNLQFFLNEYLKILIGETYKTVYNEFIRYCKD